MAKLALEQMVSRTYILKRLNISGTELNKLMNTYPRPFPKPVLTSPHPRWSLNEINDHLVCVKRTEVKPPQQKHRIVLFGGASRWGHITDPVLAEKIQAVPELMAYVDHYIESMNELFATDREIMGDDDAGFHPLTDERESGVLVNISKIPRHHPKLLELISAIPREDRCGLRLCTIPHSAYSYHEAEDGNEVYASFIAHHSTQIVKAPGDDSTLSIKMLPTSSVYEVLMRHKDNTDPRIQLLIKELDQLLDR